MELKKLRSKIKAKKTQSERTLKRIEDEEDALIQFEQEQEQQSIREPAPDEYSYGTPVTSQTSKRSQFQTSASSTIVDHNTFLSQTRPIAGYESDMDDEEQLLRDLDTENRTQKPRSTHATHWNSNDVISIDDDSPMASTSRQALNRSYSQSSNSVDASGSQKGSSGKGDLLIGKFHSNVQNDGITGEYF